MTFTTFLYRAWVFVQLLTIVAVVPGLGQDPKDLPALNSIRTPNSPAFSILSIQPTSVERPNTPADLTISIDNATEGFTEFPQNYALEFSPYWMTRLPRSVTWQSDTVRSLPKSIARTFSISFATTFKEVEGKENRGLSYGLRTFILSGRTSGESINAINAIEDNLRGLSRRFDAEFKPNVDELEKELRRRLGIDSLDKEEVRAWFNLEMSRINEKRAAALSEVTEELKTTAQAFAPQRVGVIVEAAFAGAYRNDTTSSGLKDNGYAFWLTPAYVQKDYSVVGVLRYLKDSLSNQSMEYGGRLVMTRNKYSLSVEYLKGNYRGEESLSDRERVAVLVEFVVSKNLWATISFGDDNKNPGGKNSLFSTFGLKFNMAKDRFKFE